MRGRGGSGVGCTGCSRLCNGEQELIRGCHGVNVAESVASPGHKAPGVAHVAIWPNRGGVTDDREAEFP